MTQPNRSTHQRDHTFRRTGWSEPASVAFSARTDVRPPRRKPRASNRGWWALCTIGLLGFGLLVNAMLERGADTAGPSPAFVAATQEPVVESSPVDASDAYADAPQANAAPPTVIVHKCVDPYGAVTYQNLPCDTAQSTARIYAARPDTASDAAWSRYQQRKADNDAAALSRMAGAGGAYASTSASPDDLDIRRARCNSAKAQRAATLEQVGLSRTYNLLQSLDEMVRDACRGLNP